MQLMTLAKSFNMLVNSGNIFRLASISLYMIQCLDWISCAAPLIRASKPCSRPVLVEAPSAYMPTQDAHYGCPDI